MNRTMTLVCAAAIVLAGIASAGTLPDTSNTVTFTATVTEQANVASIPSAIAFAVSDVSQPVNSASQTVSVDTIVLADGKKLRIEIAPNSANFVPPLGGTVTWAASDISWNAPSWTNGIGNATSMSASAGTYVKVADMSTANSATMSTAGLVFTLAGKSTVDHAGSHTLSATWRLSSF